jgi:hypothetical protein
MYWDIRVETNIENKINEKPVRFWVDETCLEIIEIEDRWYSQGFTYYKVFADNASHYILKRSASTGLWSAYFVQV